MMPTVIAMLVALAVSFAGGELPEKHFDIKQAPVVRAPTTGVRHAVLLNRRIPEAGVVVAVKCRYTPQSQGWGSCESLGKLDELNLDSQIAAAELMEGTRLDLSKLRSLRPVTFVTTTRVRLSPKDFVQLEPPTDPAVYVKDISWAERPSAEILRDMYPPRAQRHGKGGWVTLTCKVLDDLSPACLPVRVSEPDYGFEQVATRMVGLNRVAPTLSDGRSAVGAWFRTAVSFSTPE